jgi:protein FAM32A
MSYDFAGGSLKLKGVIDKKIKKKKKSKNQTKEVRVLSVNKPDVNDNNSNLSETHISSSKMIINESKLEEEEEQQQQLKDETQIKKPIKTKAELEFERVMDKRIEEKILKRAERSHKEHVEVYNRHLDSLSEYNDIPKVSWTK